MWQGTRHNWPRAKEVARLYRERDGSYMLVYMEPAYLYQDGVTRSCLTNIYSGPNPSLNLTGVHPNFFARTSVKRVAWSELPREWKRTFRTRGVSPRWRGLNLSSPLTKKCNVCGKQRTNTHQLAHGTQTVCADCLRNIVQDGQIMCDHCGRYYPLDRVALCANCMQVLCEADFGDDRELGNGYCIECEPAEA